MTTTYFAGRRNVQEDMPDSRVHRRELARAVNGLLKGWSNATLKVTLTASATTTTVTDPRVSIQTAPLLVPTTANAAAELGNGTLYVTPSNGQVVITHANNTQTDRTFLMALVG